MEKLKLTEDSKGELVLLTKQIEEATEKRDNLADELYQSRSGAAKRFDTILLSKIRELEMPHATFETRVEKITGFNLNGNCSVKFFFSAKMAICATSLKWHLEENYQESCSVSSL